MKDVNGGVLPGVTLRVTHVATNAIVEAVTDGEGVYRVAALATGTYRVEAVLDGFERSSLQVTVTDGRATLDVTLSPSRLTESVVVTARRVEEVAQEVPIPVSVIRVTSLPMRARST